MTSVPGGHDKHKTSPNKPHRSAVSGEERHASRSSDAAGEGIEPSAVESTVIPPRNASSLGSLVDAPSIPRGDGDNPGTTTDPMNLRPGQILLDFQIQRLLGRGAFGRVYLALQISLDRLVALKIAQDSGTEGRTMARLEHQNIVQVFAEQTIAGRPLRMLCMQFVPGPTLQTLSNDFAVSNCRSTWTGSTALELIDRRVDGPTRLLLDEFGDRASLTEMSRIEAICFWGQQLADGLHFAHAAGVLHHDIKPANILLNTSGRPLLADFNLAESLGPDEAASVVGGTLLYMAPEQLERFLNRTVVERQSEGDFGGGGGGDSDSENDSEGRTAADVFSLGLVLVELYLGELPGAKVVGNAGDCESIPAADEHAGLLKLRKRPLELHAAGGRNSEAAATTALVLQRACAPDPGDRTASARTLSRELRGCLSLGKLQLPFSRRNWFEKIASRFPFGMFMLLVAFPHVVGSFVNIAYNMARVSDLQPVSLNGEQSHAAHDQVMSAFHSLTVWYNVVLWPVCILMLGRLFLKNRPAIMGTRCEDAVEECKRRRSLIRLPGQLSAVAMLGWLPGLVVFPVGLAILAGVPIVVGSVHFGVNLLMSGSIAFSYSYMGAVWMVMTICYPRLWRFPEHLSHRALNEEASGLLRPLPLCRTAAGLVPLMSAILIVAIAPSDVSQDQYTVFRALLTVLIAVGMLGYHFSVHVTDALSAVPARTSEKQDKVGWELL
jgi:eukaryotic-like serine/threonine-protein kinase